MGAVLVTGASGGIGQLVVAELVGAGLSVVAADHVDWDTPRPVLQTTKRG